MEREIYQENINNFFNALESKDAAAIKSLFSETVVKNDRDLDEQIAKLISIYPNAKTEIKFDGLLGGDYENQDGEFKSTAYTTFPVVCDNQYFWVYFELIYEDDLEEENIGLNSVYFYTGDEYCALLKDLNATMPNDLGLLVFSDLKSEKEIRPIDSRPYEFSPIERTISVTDVETFLASNHSLTEFQERFGEPNATGYLWTYFYEITEQDGSLKYLEIGVTDDFISYANIVGEFEYIRCIFDSEV